MDINTIILETNLLEDSSLDNTWEQLLITKDKEELLRIRDILLNNLNQNRYSKKSLDFLLLKKEEIVRFFSEVWIFRSKAENLDLALKLINVINELKFKFRELITDNNKEHPLYYKLNPDE